ncbi:hypothetical protein OIV83_004720 [Microbotryomycetes sp. JL201]|nr:hypothetical protein OIV83_004720 [Microbotryomycetes sp. JL201]
MSSVVSSAHPHAAATLRAQDEEQVLYETAAGQVELTSEDRQAGYALPSTFEERTIERTGEAPYASRAADEYTSTGKTRWADEGKHRVPGEQGKSARRGTTRRHRESSRHRRRRKPKELAWWQKPRPMMCVILFVVVVALGVGLGVGLGIKRDDAATQAIGKGRNSNGPSVEPSAPGFPIVSASSRSSSGKQPPVSVSNDGAVGPIGPRTDAMNHAVPLTASPALMSLQRRSR